MLGLFKLAKERFFAKSEPLLSENVKGISTECHGHSLAYLSPKIGACFLDQPINYYDTHWVKDRPGQAGYVDLRSKEKSQSPREKFLSRFDPDQNKDPLILPMMGHATLAPMTSGSLQDFTPALQLIGAISSGKILGMGKNVVQAAKLYPLHSGGAGNLGAVQVNLRTTILDFDALKAHARVVLDKDARDTVIGNKNSNLLLSLIGMEAKPGAPQYKDILEERGVPEGCSDVCYYLVPQQTRQIDGLSHLQQVIKEAKPRGIYYSAKQALSAAYTHKGFTVLEVFQKDVIKTDLPLQYQESMYVQRNPDHLTKAQLELFSERLRAGKSIGLPLRSPLAVARPGKPDWQITNPGAAKGKILPFRPTSERPSPPTDIKND